MSSYAALASSLVWMTARLGGWTWLTFAYGFARTGRKRSRATGCSSLMSQVAPCGRRAAGAAAEHSVGRRVHTLQYPVRIAVLGEPVLVDGDAPKARLHRLRLRSRRRRTKTLGPRLGLAPVR